MRGIGRLALAVLLGWLAAAPLAAKEWQAIPLPKLPAGVIELRVAYVVNPRLPAFSPDEIPALLTETTRIVRAHFGVEVAFRVVETVDVEALFARLNPKATPYLDSLRYDFIGGTGDRNRLVRAYVDALPKKRAAFDAVYDFAAPYLVAPPASRDRRGLAQALTQTQLARLESWRAAPALDGKPMLEARPVNEWVYWQALGYLSTGWDVMVTNQLVAGAEYVGAAVHAALRGVEVGATDYGKSGRFGTLAWISSFPFVSDLPALVAMRDGETYDPATARRLVGAYLAHEIGHQLFHFGHPFGNPHCVMTPARLLKFREWLAGLDPETCRVGSAPAMRPGAVKFRIDPTRRSLL